MSLILVELFISFCIGYVSSTEYVFGILGCSQELLAEIDGSKIPTDATTIFWGRQDIGGNILSYTLSTDETLYINVYNETKYTVNDDTNGLIVKDITIEDADIYTRSVFGATNLEVNFTVLLESPSPEDLNDILVIYYDGKMVTSENATLTINAEDTEPLQASTNSSIENAGESTLVWINALSGTTESLVGTTANLDLKPGIFFVKSSLCNIEAISFNVTIVDIPDENEVCNSLNYTTETGTDHLNVTLRRDYLPSFGYRDIRADVTSTLSNGTDLSCKDDKQYCVFTIVCGTVYVIATEGMATVSVAAEGTNFKYYCNETFDVLEPNCPGEAVCVTTSSLLASIVFVLVVFLHM